MSGDSRPPRAPWRDPKESDRALEQRARNDGARPKCKHCGAELRACVYYDWPMAAPRPRCRWIDGYGESGRGLFCSNSCARRHGYLVYRDEEVKGDI